MNKQAKTILGLGAIAVVLYLILRPKGANAQTTTSEVGDYMPTINTTDPYICPKGFTKSLVLDEQYTINENDTTSYHNACKDSNGNIKPFEINTNYKGNYFKDGDYIPK